MRLGILPAAGKAVRWAGYPKELLPISSGSTLLSRAADSLRVCGCDAVVVITNPSKVQWHAHHLGYMDNVVLAIQKGVELWGAITTAIGIEAAEYYFMMPDTVVPARPFPETLESEFAVGLFATDEPERFGVIRDGQIVDKRPSDSPGRAWGVLAWKRSVAEYWNRRAYPGHTAALNEAISVFGYGEWVLDYYYDIGSMKHYVEFLQSEHSKEPEADTLARVIGSMGYLGDYARAPDSNLPIISSLKEPAPHE